MAMTYTTSDVFQTLLIKYRACSGIADFAKQIGLPENDPRVTQAYTALGLLLNSINPTDLSKMVAGNVATQSAPLNTLEQVMTELERFATTLPRTGNYPHFSNMLKQVVAFYKMWIK